MVAALIVTVAGLIAALVLRSDRSLETLDVLDGAADLIAVDNRIVIDHATNTLRSVERPPASDHPDGRPPHPGRQWGLGGGGLVAITIPPTINTVNRIELKYQPVNDFPATSLVLRVSNPKTGRESALIARRHTSDGSVRLTWTVDTSIQECWLDLPFMSELVVQSVSIMHYETAPRSLARVLNAAIVLPVMILCVSVAIPRRDDRKARLLFAMAWILHALIVGWLAGLGHSDAVDSYQMVAQVVGDGAVVFAETDRYNYGIIWSWIIGGVVWFHDGLGLAGPETLHVLLASIIILGNFALGVILARAFHPAAGCAFALMPPVILLAGFHSAFDTLGLALGLLSIFMISEDQRRRAWSWVIAAAIVMACSLILKHWMAFFLLWVLLWQPLGPLRRRMVFIGVSAGLFGLHFVPFLFDESSRYAIVHNVFLHHSGAAHSLTAKIFKYATTAGMYEWVVALRILQLTWLGAVAAFAWLLRREKHAMNLAMIYLVVFVAFAPHMGDVYLLGGLVACAAYCRSIIAWLFVATSTVTILASPHNVLYAFPDFAAALPSWVTGRLHRGDVHQFVLLLLLAQWWRSASRDSIGRPMTPTSNREDQPSDL